VVFDRREEILCAYLFGSRARGTAGPASDVDIAVLRRPGNYASGLTWQTYWGDLHAELCAALGIPADRLDVVLLDELRDTLLAHRATWFGRRIFCRDEIARVRHEARVLIRFLDTGPLRKIQEDVLRRALGAGRGS
jgi:predicted nucleotidyltransferase